MSSYQPERYWEERLSKRFSLGGVGHICFSEDYNRWLYRAKERTLTMAFTRHGIGIRGKAVCDLGCGTGFFVEFCANRGVGELAGVDVTEITINRLARRWPLFHFVRGDISSSSFVHSLTEKFDLVNALDVLYHITDDEAFLTAMGNISRLCRSGGWVLMSDLFDDADRDEAAHVRFRSASRYESALAACGMEVMGVHPLYFMLNRPLFGRKIDNLAAPLYYALDGIIMSRQRSNLKLLVAQKRP